VPTHGGHARLSPAQQEELLEGLAAALDAAGGGFTMRFDVLVLTTTLTA